MSHGMSVVCWLCTSARGINEQPAEDCVLHTGDVAYDCWTAFRRVRHLQLYFALDRWQTDAAGRFQGQGCADGERGEPMWIHAAVQGTGSALREVQRQGIRDPWFSGEQFRSPRTGHERRDQNILLANLQ